MKKLYAVILLSAYCNFASANVSIGYLRRHAEQYPVPTMILFCAALLAIILFIAVVFLVSRQLKARKTLRENGAASELLESVSENMGMQFFRLSLDGGRLDDSPNTDSFWEYDDSGKALIPENLILETDLEKFRKNYANLLSKKKPQVKFDFGIKRNGEIFYCEFFGVVKSSKIYKRKIIEGFVREKNAETIARRKLDARNKLVDAILEELPTIICVKDLNSDSTIIECSKSYSQIIGRDKKKILGHKEWEWLPNSEYLKIREKDLKAISSDNNYENSEHYATDSKGKIRVLRFKHRVFDDGHSGKFLLNVATDITEDRRKTEELSDSKRYLDLILSAIPCIITLKDIANDYKYFDCNEAMCKMLGVDKAKVLGKNDTELFPKNDYYRERLLDVAVAKGGGEKESITKFYDGTGTLRFARIFRRKVKIFGRDLLMSTVIDITEFERAQSDLRRDGKIMQAVLENIPAWVAVKDIGEDFRYLLWNRKAEEFSGIKTSEILGKRDYDFPILKEYAGQFRQNSAIAAKNDEGYNVIQYDWTLPDGRKILLEGYIIHIDCDGKKYEIAMGHDITALHILNSTEKEKLLLIDAIGIPAVLFDTSHKLLHANAAAKKISGTADDGIYAQPCHKLFCKCAQFPPDCPVEMTLGDAKSHKDSRKIFGRDYEEIAEPIFVEGKMRYVLKYLIDVTDKNTMQNRLGKMLENTKDSSAKMLNFIASLAVGLRESANGMIGSAELISATAGTNADNADFAAMRTSSDAIMGLLDNMQDFIKIESGAIKIREGSFIPVVFFSDIKKYFPRNIGLECKNVQVPALVLNGEIVKIILTNWIMHIGAKVPQCVLEARFLKGERLEILIRAKDADKIYKNDISKSVALRLSEMFIEKLGAATEFSPDAITLAIDHVERL